jgi:hypothetical protein
VDFKQTSGQAKAGKVPKVAGWQEHMVCSVANTVATATTPTLQVGDMAEDLARVEKVADRPLTMPKVYSQEQTGSMMPHPTRLRAKLDWWGTRAPPQVLQWLKQGVPAQWPSQQPPSLPWMDRGHPQEEVKACMDIIQDYLQVGAVKELSDSEVSQIKFLVPWFIITKKGRGGETQVDIRLQTDKQSPPTPKFQNGPFFSHVRTSDWVKNWHL